MKLFKYIVLTILMSLYIFPIEFRFLPSINSKMILAALGILTLLTRIATRKQDGISNIIIKAGILAALVSTCGIISVLYNSTNDFTYATYFISFATWTLAAYFIVICTQRFMGSVNPVTICKLLIYVAISQCILALVIDLYSPFKAAVNSIVVGFASMHSAGTGLDVSGRLYGIGAALDVAGTRFSAILGMIGILCYQAHEKNQTSQEIWFSFLFIFLLIVGSFISRTTGIGAIFTAIFFIIASRGKIVGSRFLLLPICVSMIALVYVLFLINPTFEEYVRFGFEGFVNMIEKGSWQVNSTDTLKSMYVFPESIKTWAIGDGYFNEPSIFDSNYIGDVTDYGLFYMGTDVGYLRFLFYFGAIGLTCFILYFISNAISCIKGYPKYKWIFLDLLFINLVIWLKVATDIYCLFALFLCLRSEYDEPLIKEQNSTLFETDFND